MKLPKNQFKAAILAGQRQIGLWVALANPYTAEICAGAGFDWLMIDGEHAPNDVRTMLAQLQSIGSHPVSSVVRPPVGDRHVIKQLLDLGAQTILVPMVETADQARELVASVRYPPRGARGVGSGVARAAGWGQVKNYLAEADDQICLLVQIETTLGVENATAIAAVDGVDGIFVGPSDLSAALGHIGNPTHPEVHTEIDTLIAGTRAAGKPSGILVTDVALAHAYLEKGCAFVAVGTDVSILIRGLKDLATKFK